MKNKKALVSFVTFLLFAGALTAYAQSRYVLYCDSNLKDVSLQLAEKEVGTLETGTNGGAVTKYLKILGLNAGNPYCAAGQYWCFWMATKELKFSEKAIPIKKTALAQAIFNDARSRGRKAAYIPQVSDLIVWRRGRTSFGHIERIRRVLDKGNVETIAFNSSSVISGKKREGVFIKKRNVRHPLGRLFVKGLVGFEER
jgi:hypothetical protein